MSGTLSLSPDLTAALSSQSWNDILKIGGLEIDPETQLLHSRVVTFMWALVLGNPLHLRDKTACTVLIAGAAQREETLAKSGAFNLLGELVPEVSWRFILVGPSLSRDTKHIDGKQVQIHLVPGYLHGWSARQMLQEFPPDCAILFNSGIGCSVQDVTEPWQKSLPILAQCQPVLFTSFSVDEARREQMACSTIAWDGTLGAHVWENPFAVQGDHDGRAASGVVHNRVVWWLAGSRPNAKNDQACLTTDDAQSQKEQETVCEPNVS